MMAHLDDLLIDPPIVDMLCVDPSREAFDLTFLPDDDLSDEPKLCVTIPMASVEGHQVKTWLDEFSRLLDSHVSISRVVHGGGGDFTFSFTDATTRYLSDPNLDAHVTQRVYDGLRYIAQAAANAYRIVQVNLSQTA